ncbi:hypothetical protein K458DRAFT_310759 [Lentithecium fluviatile CBS 122367]|uniref:BSD domain-containing protein n=1 Tax=Lentithecium fluviatile CBS 122367 TaxID=1168545 RepID=A0A6G1IRC6_9PLEO|nr:hypothetical protein K458DRAFT_310759 [Lentithecium fluviatile CBS 122367]
MDTAYDHIQEEAYPRDPTPQPPGENKPAPADFNSEVQDAYKAISSSPWAARLGGFLGTVKKQGEQYYDGASKQATAGFSNLIKHTRNLSVHADPSAAGPDGEGASTTTRETADTEAHPDRPESLPADIVKEAEGMLARLRSEAAKRLKTIEKAEDAADEALLKFGTNIRSFLRDAVTIAPPAEGSSEAEKGAVMFESKDSSGKKVVHATRFDAQLHVIHSSLDSFMKDPMSPEWEGFKKDFDVEKKTEAIAKDLEKHAELRIAMEKCVPEKVEYAAFWCRYYFLRHVIESEEARRREMLKASTPADEEEIAWDEDSDSDAGSPSSSTPKTTKTPATNLAASTKTLKPEAAPAEDDSLKPAQPRRSNDEKSVADSDASYDLVSGATSRAPGSPQDRKKDAVAEESDEEDWE